MRFSHSSGFVHHKKTHSGENLMDVIFARKNLNKKLLLSTTKGDICCATLVAERLYNHKMWKNILLSMNMMEGICAVNVRNGVQIL
jgi:hypothetical protein